MRSDGLTRQSVAPGSVVLDIDQMSDNLNSTGVMYETGGSITTTGAEQTLLIMDDPLGIALVSAVIVDFDAMVGGDTIVFRTYYRIGPGLGMQLYDYDSWVGADGGLANGEKLDTVSGGYYRYGYRLTIQRTGGVDHAFPWAAWMIGE